jgi:hypothetical protein
MIEVRDGSRTLQFNGVLLSDSTSWRKGSTRWIEFTLYKTESGSYILSRIGVSLVYHTASCALVKRYGLQEVPSSDLTKDAISCEDCGATRSATIVFPEKSRYWSQVSEDPGAVLDALYKFDESGARYLTNVAQRLLEDASDVDSGIESIYRVEIIP